MNESGFIYIEMWVASIRVTQLSEGATIWGILGYDTSASLNSKGISMVGTDVKESFWRWGFTIFHANLLVSFWLEKAKIMEAIFISAIITIIFFGCVCLCALCSRPRTWPNYHPLMFSTCYSYFNLFYFLFYLFGIDLAKLFTSGNCGTTLSTSWWWNLSSSHGVSPLKKLSYISLTFWFICKLEKIDVW